MKNTISMSEAWLWANSRADEWVRRTGANPKLRPELAKAITRAILKEGREPSADTVFELANALRAELECA